MNTEGYVGGELQGLQSGIVMLAQWIIFIVLLLLLFMALDFS